MLKYAVVILRITGIENRQNLVRARIVASSVKEQVGHGQAPGCGDVERERAGGQKRPFWKGASA